MNSRSSYLLAAAGGLAAWILAAWIIAGFLFGTALYPGEPLRGGWTPVGLICAIAGLVVALVVRAIFRHHGDDRAPTLPKLTRRAERKLTAGVLLVHALLAIAMSWDLPLFEGPDESSHFDYARYIAYEGRLPALHIDGRALESDVAIDQKIQPPFDYLCLAPALWAIGATEWSTFYPLAPPRAASDRPESWKAARYQHGADELAPCRSAVLTLHLLRLSGIVFTWLALLGLRRALRTLRFARSTTLAVLAIFACLPQLVHLAGVFTNDLPAIAAGTWSVALASRFLAPGPLEYPQRARTRSVARSLRLGQALRCRGVGLDAVRDRGTHHSPSTLARALCDGDLAAPDGALDRRCSRFTASERAVHSTRH